MTRHAVLHIFLKLLSLAVLYIRPDDHLISLLESLWLGAASDDESCCLLQAFFLYVGFTLCTLVIRIP